MIKYSENSLIEQPAIELFQPLSYGYQDCFHEIFGKKSTFDKQKLLDMFENFILFSDTGGSLIKIIAKNHQFFGVNKTLES